MDESRRKAAGLVRDGRSVSLANPLATARVLSGTRNPRPAKHDLDVGDHGSSDYIGVSYHGFVNTHIDALCHIFTEDGRLYNNRPASDVTAEGAQTHSIDQWRRGIVTRGVPTTYRGIAAPTM
jgi:hypothetical protein